MFENEIWFLAGGIGAGTGSNCTCATALIQEKRKAI